MNPDAGGRIPGLGVAAATLGFVEGALALSVAVLVLGDTVDSGTGDETLLAVAVLEVLVALGALTLLGSLFLVRGTGRRLLVGVTIAELVLVLGLVVLAMVVLATEDRSYSYSSDDGLITACFVVALVAPAVRLALVTQPAVGSWLSARRAPAGWPARRSSSGPVVALMTPAALLAVVVVVVLSTAEEPVDFVVNSGVPPVVVGTAAGG